MGKLYNMIVWFIKNCTSICLVFVVLTSIHPFYTCNHGHNYYTFIGLLLTFMSTIFTRWHIKDGIKQTKFYHILSIIIMALGVTSLFFISEKKETTPYTDFELFMTTYFGATLGLVFGTMTNDLINGERKNKDRNSQITNQLKKISSLKLNWIDVTKQMPTHNIEVLCRGENGGYFVGVITKKDYGKGNDKYVYEANSGDEGMNHVVCWIYLDEIEKTINEEILKK